MLAFYCSLGLRHPERAPLLLVEDSALNEYSPAPGGRTGPTTHTRGICLTEQCTSVRVASLLRRHGQAHSLSSVVRFGFKG